MADKPTVGRIEFGPALDGLMKARTRGEVEFYSQAMAAAPDNPRRVIAELRTRITELEQALAAERARAQAAEADAGARAQVWEVLKPHIEQWLSGEYDFRTMPLDEIQAAFDTFSGLMSTTNPGAAYMAVVEAAQQWDKARTQDELLLAEGLLRDALATLHGGGTATITEAERLAEIAHIIERVDNRCMAAEGSVTPTRLEMTDDELRTIYRLAKGETE